VRRALAALAAGVAALVVAAPASANDLALGIADQKADTFLDPRVGELGLRHARIGVSWNVMEVGYERARLDRWLATVQQQGITPLINFQHSALDRRDLPRPEEFVAQFRALRERHPQVTQFAVWNEANHCGQPTCNRPELVAAYWRKLSLACRECTILAAEVLDLDNMSRWLLDFREHTRKNYRGDLREPSYWGLHNYVDANRFRTIGTRRMRAHTRGEIWLTEVGGIVARNNRSDLRLPESPSHAARATQWLLEELVPLTSRIRRLYIYHWQIDELGGSWDSGLITPGGRERPAYRVLEDYVERRREGEGDGDGAR
jgi:hypothetical protein